MKILAKKNISGVYFRPVGIFFFAVKDFVKLFRFPSDDIKRPTKFFMKRGPYKL